MINTDMKLYNFYIYGEKNAYGQVQPSNEVKGQVKMAIYETSQAIQDNINYKQASFIGLTRALLDDTYLIEYNGQKLKVQYVTPKGRLYQVFLAKI